MHDSNDEVPDKVTAISVTAVSQDAADVSQKNEVTKNGSDHELLKAVEGITECDICVMNERPDAGDKPEARAGEIGEHLGDQATTDSTELEIDRNEEQQTVTELVQASNGGVVVEAGEARGMRVAFGIVLRLMLPLANRVVRRLRNIRDARFLRILTSIASSRQALTNLLAFAANSISMNLSSVQVTHRIEPLLKLLKIRKSKNGIESLPDTPGPEGLEFSSPPTTTSTLSTPSTPPMSPALKQPKASVTNFPSSRKKSQVHEAPAPKCCSINVLAEPPAGCPITADIVFIHGLHGSLVNTWKQGLWENERKPLEFKRPPKPPVRPPKRPRHSHSAVIRSPHKHKRARIALTDMPRRSTEGDLRDDFEDLLDSCEQEKRVNFSYICGGPENIETYEGLDYSFPTFRLRIDNEGHLVQAEVEALLQGDSSNDPAKETPPKHPKLSPNDPKYSKCWPADWLPLDCPGVRVIAVNYTTDQYLWRPLWKKKEPRTNLAQRAREMAELLIEKRVGHGHPVVWVGHSKGGLFIKQILVNAWESGRPAEAPLWRSARGVFFYSVPHRGSHLASIKAPLLTRSVELMDIEKNSKYLLDLHRRFAGLYHLGHLKIEVFSFVEMALTLMSVLYLRIVGVDSADPGIGDVCGIRLDHREICKPRGRDCILYKKLVKMINKVCEPCHQL